MGYDDDVEFERLISKLYISRIQKKRGRRVNLSVSMPEELKTDFLLACSYNDEDYKDLFISWINAYLKEKGLDVIIPRKESRVHEEQQELEELRRISTEKQDARLKVATQFIFDRILKLIKIPMARGEWRTRDEPVETREILPIVNECCRKYNIRREDACDIIMKRAEKMESKTLRKSFNAAVHEILLSKEETNGNHNTGKL